MVLTEGELVQRDLSQLQSIGDLLGTLSYEQGIEFLTTIAEVADDPVEREVAMSAAHILRLTKAFLEDWNIIIAHAQDEAAKYDGVIIDEIPTAFVDFFGLDNGGDNETDHL